MKEGQPCIYMCCMLLLEQVYLQIRLLRHGVSSALDNRHYFLAGIVPIVLSKTVNG